MNVKTISRLLITFSVVLIVIAMTMDTTVSTGYGRVVNIGLVNDKNNLLLLGCAAFIAGIILFATAKVKQTPEELLSEKAEAEKNVEKVQQTITSFPEKVLSHLKGLDNPVERYLVVIFVGFIPAFVHPILPALLALYALRSIPASKVMTHLLSLNIVILLIGAASAIIEASTSPFSTGFVIFLSIVFVLLFSTTVGVLVYIKKSEASKHQASKPQVIQSD